MQPTPADECWVENVGPLITALQILGIDPVDWACDHDFEVFYEKDAHGAITRHLRAGLDSLEPDTLHFACGYLQATGNLTGQTWAEQIDEFLAAEKARQEQAAPGYLLSEVNREPGYEIQRDDASGKFLDDTQARLRFVCDLERQNMHAVEIALHLIAQAMDDEKDLTKPASLLSTAFGVATDTGLFDQLMGHVKSADSINDVCDALASWLATEGKKSDA